jgi:flagellar basal body-associated protein FliL
MAEDTKTAAAQPAAKKSKKTLLIGAVGLLVVCGAGAAYWYTRPPAEPSAEGESAAEHEAEGESVLSFEPFVVNLADVQIVIAGAVTGAEVEEDPVAKVRLRSEVLALLMEQQSDTLMTPEGKEALKQAIRERASHSLEPHKVTDVLFSDFIVQR